MFGRGEAKTIVRRELDDDMLERIEELLGYPGRAALVHRDDMVIWGM